MKLGSNSHCGISCSGAFLPRSGQGARRSAGSAGDAAKPATAGQDKPDAGAPELTPRIPYRRASTSLTSLGVSVIRRARRLRRPQPSRLRQRRPTSAAQEGSASRLRRKRRHGAQATPGAAMAATDSYVIGAYRCPCRNRLQGAHPVGQFPCPARRHDFDTASGRCAGLRQDAAAVGGGDYGQAQEVHAGPQCDRHSQPDQQQESLPDGRNRQDRPHRDDSRHDLCWRQSPPPAD